MSGAARGDTAIAERELVEDILEIPTTQTTGAPPSIGTGPGDRGPGDPPTSHEPPPARGWGLPLAVLIVGMFMSVLDTSVVNVAIPVIQKQFGDSATEAQWISTSYSLTEGIMVTLSAWLGTRVGPKRLYIWSLVGFTVASALCGLSDNLASMVIFRFVQGIPGGMLPVTCLTMLYRMVPKEKFGAAMGMYGLGVVVAPAIGPTLGGYFSEYFSWRLVYYVNVPIGILGAVAAAAVLVPVPGQRDKRFDLPGFLCVAGALLALLLAIEEGPDWGWTGYRVLILFTVALDLFVLFVIVEFQAEQPLMNLRVFTRPQFGLSLILMTVFSVALFGEFFYIPQFLQGVRNYSPMQAGLALVPQALALVVLMPITGRLYDRFGPRWLVMMGMTLVGTGTLILSQLNVDMTETKLIIGMFVMGTGLGLGFMPTFSGGLATLPDELNDAGSSLNTLTQRVSQALGLGILSVMVTADRAQFMANRAALVHGGADGNPQVVAMQQQGQTGLLSVWQQLSGMVQAQAYTDVFYVCALLSLGGIMLALFLPTGRPTGAKAVAH